MAHEEFLARVPIFANCTAERSRRSPASPRRATSSPARSSSHRARRAGVLPDPQRARRDPARRRLARRLRPRRLLRRDVAARPGAALGDDPRARPHVVPDALELGLQGAAREAPVDRHQAARGAQPPAARGRRADRSLTWRTRGERAATSCRTWPSGSSRSYLLAARSDSGVRSSSEPELARARRRHRLHRWAGSAAASR